jgi:hypothetical protein
MKLQFLKSSVIILLVAFMAPGATAAFLGITSGSCTKDKVSGYWQHTAEGMIWEFLESGLLNCEGVCDFKGVKPVAWSASGSEKITTSLEIYLTSKKLPAACSMAAGDMIMNLDAFGTFRRIEKKP